MCVLGNCGTFCFMSGEMYVIQARTQGFEKGGYIVKKFPIEFLAF